MAVMSWPASSTRPLRRLPQAHDRAQRGGLAGAVAAQQHGQLAARHDEVDAMQDVVRPDVRVHAFQREQVVAHAASLATPRYASWTMGEAITSAGSPSATSAAVVQHDDAVGQFAHHVHLVFHQQDRLGLVRLQPADQVEDDGRLGRVHAGRGLVEHEHLRLQRHQHRDLQLALVAVRQVGHELVLLVLQRDGGQDAVGALHQRLVVAPDAPQVEAPAVGAVTRRLHGQPHVLQHGEAREQVGELEGAADAGPGAVDGDRRDRSRPPRCTVPALAGNWPEIRLK
jgi:hypothetical protein